MAAGTRHFRSFAGRDVTATGRPRSFSEKRILQLRIKGRVLARVCRSHKFYARNKRETTALLFTGEFRRVVAYERLCVTLQRWYRVASWYYRICERFRIEINDIFNSSVSESNCDGERNGCVLHRVVAVSRCFCVKYLQSRIFYFAIFFLWLYEKIGNDYTILYLNFKIRTLLFFLFL